MGFRAGPFVLCKDGCCHQRRRNTNFGPENFFSLKNFPPHMCSQNDQRDVGIILSHVCWGRTPARQVGQPQPKPPSRHGDQGGGGGGWANGLTCHPPPAKQFSSRHIRAIPRHHCGDTEYTLAPRTHGLGAITDASSGT